MERLMIFVGRPNKSVAPTKYFFKVQQVGRFIPLVGGISRRVESPLIRFLNGLHGWGWDLISFHVICKSDFSVKYF